MYPKHKALRKIKCLHGQLPEVMTTVLCRHGDTATSQLRQELSEVQNCLLIDGDIPGEN